MRVVLSLATGTPTTPWSRYSLTEFSDRDVTVLDVRTCSEFAAGHLPGAQHIPYTHLRARLDEVARGKPVLCYCRSGNRSARAAAFLARSGFEAFNMRGGFWPYAGRGYRVER
jgi:rhodanese-related sulfurtransferase